MARNGVSFRGYSFEISSTGGPFSGLSTVHVRLSIVFHGADVGLFAYWGEGNAPAIKDELYFNENPKVVLLIFIQKI